jgi:hypothetical protein
VQIDAAEDFASPAGDVQAGDVEQRLSQRCPPA